MRLLALLGTILAISPLAAQQAPIEPDFERRQAAEDPTGWAWAAGLGYSIASVDSCDERSARCTVVRGAGGSHAPAYLTKSFDAAAFRGSQIRFNADVRLEYPAISRAEIFVRVDRPSGTGFRGYAPRGRSESRDWTIREVVGTIDDDATLITVGLRFTGLGAVYLADAKFETLQAED